MDKPDLLALPSVEFEKIDGIWFASAKIQGWIVTGEGATIREARLALDHLARRRVAASGDDNGGVPSRTR